MTTSDLIAKSYLTATGEVSTLASSDADYKKLLAIANMKIGEWAGEPGVDWASLYDTVDIGTVGAADTFDLDDSIFRISNQPGDYVQILRTDGKVTSYTAVEPKRLKKYTQGNYCAKVGSTLKFNKAFSSDDPEYGGTIKVPCYVLPSDLVNDANTVPVDNPQWLVVITAAEWTRNDVTLSNQYPNLVADANNLMDGMKIANRAQEETVRLSSVARGTEW